MFSEWTLAPTKCPPFRPPSVPNLYDADTQRALFDTMVTSYHRVNTITSLGVCHLWRRRCVEIADLQKGDVVRDDMSGSGEFWRDIASKIGDEGRIEAVDFSPVSCARAARSRERTPIDVALHCGDVFTHEPETPVDAIVCGFGLKTLSPTERRHYATCIARRLKPGGRFASVEISVPTLPVFREAFLWYLRVLVPIAGRLFLGNADCYRMLYHYTVRFDNSQTMAQYLREAGMEVTHFSYCFGAATAIRAINRVECRCIPTDK
jgi:ubiquinone/menaquinone biosynthesis C-methylase UbiE